MTTASSKTSLSIPHRILLAAAALILMALTTLGVYGTFTSRSQVVLYDFYVPWHGLRAMLHDGVNPYGGETTLAAEWNVVGPLASEYQSEFQLELGYPLYVMFLIGPLTWLPLSWAQAVWLAILELSLLLFILSAPRAVRWRPSTRLLAFVAIVTLGWYSTAWAIFLGQISIVVAACVALSWWGMRTEHWTLAGVCLALSTVKPQIVFLLIPGALLWGAYRRHWRMVLVFAITLSALVVLPMLWEPAWPLRWLYAMRRYTGYTLFPSPALAALTGILLLAWTAYRWWRMQRHGYALDWALSMLLVTSTLAAPRTTYVNQLVLLLPLFLVFRQIPRQRIIVGAGLALLIGPWLLDILFAPPLGAIEHMLWQQRVINPMVPVGLTLALVALSPRPLERTMA